MAVDVGGGEGGSEKSAYTHCVGLTNSASKMPDDKRSASNHPPKIAYMNCMAIV